MNISQALIRRRAGRPAVGSATTSRPGGESSPFTGIDWSVSYVAFIVYTFVITTYRLPLGTAAMSVALIALPAERQRLRLPPIAYWSVALLAWSFLGWFVTDHPGDVWAEIIEFSKICGVVLVSVNVLTSRARLRFFLLSFLGFFALYPVRGTLFSYFIYGGAVDGRAAWNYAYANPNDLAAACLLVLSLAVGMLVSESRKWIRLCATAGVIVLPFVILLTQSRGALIALLAFGGILFKGQRGRRGRILLAAGAVAVVVAVAAPSSMWQRFGTLSQVTNEASAAAANDEGSARQRLEIWKVARTIIAEHPVIGVGIGAYPDAHYTYSQRPEFNPIALGYRDTHSTYLNVLAETGFVGFGIFLMIILATVIDCERVRRDAKRLAPKQSMQLLYLEFGLFGFLVAGIWGSYGKLVITYLYLSLMFVAAQLLRDELRHRFPVSRPRRLSTGRADVTTILAKRAAC